MTVRGTSDTGSVVKIGRTHLEDATPLTVGQEWSGYAAQIEDACEHLASTRRGLYRLAMGGTVSSPTPPATSASSSSKASGSTATGCGRTSNARS